MRKYASLLAVAALVAAPVAHAQGIHRASYGVMAGANFAKLDGTDVTNANARTGLYAGLYANWHLIGSLSLQPEVLYSMEGLKADDGTGGTITGKMDYIRVPVMLRLSVPTPGPVKPFVAAGPSFGYQIKCDVSDVNGGTTTNGSCADAGMEKKNFDMSGKAEAGMDLTAGHTKLTVGATYSYGFTDAFKATDAKNRAFSVFAAIGF